VTEMKFKLFTLIVLNILILGGLTLIPSAEIEVKSIDEAEIIDPVDEWNSWNSTNSIEQTSDSSEPRYPSNIDLDDFLGERVNDYRVTYEPWKSKAAIHAVTYDDETGFLALGGGYLYDNEVHLYRLNQETGEFDKVYELGSGIISGDVMSIDFGDTDLNDFIEIAVGSTDGHVYVFEQCHLYDPNTNLENHFDLVWRSQAMAKSFVVKIDDTDCDQRPEVIAAGWDGLIHIYEYSNRSGYPFVEEHWIDYVEVATLEVGEKIYSLETGDTNYNGLPEIVVGTREGRVFVFENAGTTLMVNEVPYPLTRDNEFYLNWTSENYTWQPIRSMAIGELDSTPGDEIALISEGQGVFTLDWNPTKKSYDYKKVQREYATWESYGLHGLDYWIDKVVYADNVTYFDPINASIIIEEPIEYEWNETYGMFLPNASVYPYNTGMATTTDGNYSTFDANQTGVESVTAVVDFGKDEEGTGSASTDFDLVITFKESLTSSFYWKFNFSIGQTPDDLKQIHRWKLSIQPTDHHRLWVDVDDVLSENEWDWFRYAQLTVYNDGNYSVNSIELAQVYNLLTDALSLTIGPMRLDGLKLLTGQEESNKIVVATVTGEFMCIEYDDSSGAYILIWESYDDERYIYGAYVWDLEYISSPSDIPVFAKFSLDVPTLEPPFSLGYNSWSYGVISPLLIGGDGKPNYIMGTDEYAIYAYDMNGELDTEANSYVGILAEKRYTSAEIVWLWPDEGFLPMVVVGSYDPYLRYGAPNYFHGTGSLDFYSRNALDESFGLWAYMPTIDWTGELTSILSYSKTTPRVSFADFDGDNDLDFVLSNGKLYLARNLYQERQGESVRTFLTLEHGYFDDLNQISGITWGQPDMKDIDGDGDFDLILSYTTKLGSTCFINKGTATNPIWEEERRIFNNPDLDTNMELLGLTDSRLVPASGGYTLQNYLESTGGSIQGNYCLAAYNPSTNDISWGVPFYDATDSYLIATYPKVAKMEFCLAGGDFKNLGFHIHESWNTESDLEGWTLAITSGDIDNDGRGEFIVGDYDGNVYAFEHLTNNSYKRMFRSFDLNHSILTDSSPYAHLQLEGISGEFYRSIWDHAKHLLVDTDLDGDGLKELIVASDLQVYIFEATGIDDTLEFAYELDLRDLGFIVEESQVFEQVDEITALEAGPDIDYDGRYELVLAAGPFLIIFNVPESCFEGLENLDYFSTDKDVDGRYYLVGNPEGSYQFQDDWIRTLTVGDTDDDDYWEVIIGGELDVQKKDSNGFVYIYECIGGTFYKAWEAPLDIVEWNPVSSLIIDDQDYDGSNEIIIGHTKGVDILEWIPGSDNQYTKVEVISSSPNYPKIPLASTEDPDLGVSLTNRSATDIMWCRGSLAGYAYMVYVNDSQSGYGDLCLSIYDSSSSSWIMSMANIYASSREQFEPSLVATDQGGYFVFRTLMSGTYDMWVSKINFNTGSFDPSPTLFYSDCSSTRHHPKVFEYNSTHIGIMYVQDFIIGNSRLYYHILDKDLSGGWSSWGTPHSLEFKNREDFDVHSASIVRMQDGTYAIAMSARNTESGKLDYDIWTIVGNSSFNFENSIPHQATANFYDEIYPDIDYLRDDNRTLIVAYENRGAHYDDRIGIVASTTNGSMWTDEQTLNPMPPNLTRVENSDGYIDYYFDGTLTYYCSPMAMAPSVLGLLDSGFMYVMAFAIQQGTYADILYGTNQDSAWTHNHLHDVSEITVGDTDSDSRREILVAFEDRFCIYELVHSTNGSGFMTYEEVYCSEHFQNDVTGLTVYDANGNGWKEIGVSCEHGEVYFLEFSDLSDGATELLFSDEVWTLETNGMAYTYGIASADIDLDMKEEIVLNPYGGNLYVVDNNGSILVNSTIGTDLIWIELHDLDGDSVPEILSKDDHDNLLALNVTTGAILWNYTEFTDDIYSWTVADINNDGLKEIAIGTYNSEIHLINSTGLQWRVIITDPGYVYAIALGDFTNNTYLDLAYGNGTQAVKVIDPLSETLIYESPNDMIQGTNFQPMLAHDFDGDGYEDVIFGHYMVQMINVMSGHIFYNSSTIGRPREAHLADFDGDNAMELFVLTKDCAYIVEKLTLVTQWKYTANMGELQTCTIGPFGGLGDVDIAITANQSVIITLDGVSGLPIWLNITGRYLQGIGSVDFDGDGLRNVLGWRYPSGLPASSMIVFEGVARAAQSDEPAFKVHSTYWNIPLSGIQQMWASDVNDDGYDEVFVKTHDKYLSLWDVYNGTMIWNISMHGVIEVVRFGDLDGSSNQDIGVLVDEDYVILFDSVSRAKLGYIYAPEDYQITDFHIANFDGGTDTEIAALFQRTTNTRSYVAWFDSECNWMYTSSENSSQCYAYMAIGHLGGSSDIDVVYGGMEGIARVCSGEDGHLLMTYDQGSPIRGIIVGSFNEDSGRDEFALKDTDSITLVNTKTQTVMYTVDLNSGMLLGFYAVDFDANGYSNLVTFVRYDGVTAYDKYGTMIWSMKAPVRYNYGTELTNCVFEDMNGDLYDDLIFTNYDHIAIMSGNTGNMLWHYVNDDGCYNVLVGSFDSNEATVDIIAYTSDSFYVVSGNETAEAFPPPTSGLSRIQDGFIVSLIEPSKIETPTAFVRDEFTLKIMQKTKFKD
jgi:hypothetical protein